MNWPAFILGFFVSYVLVKWVLKKIEKHTSARTTNIQPKTKKLSKNDEELITAILPVVNGKR